MGDYIHNYLLAERRKKLNLLTNQLNKKEIFIIIEESQDDACLDF